MVSPIDQFLELLTLGQAQLTGLAATLNGDAYLIGGQLISAFSNGGSLLITGLGQLANALPSLPSAGSIPGL